METKGWRKKEWKEYKQVDRRNEKELPELTVQAQAGVFPATHQTLTRSPKVCA